MKQTLRAVLTFQSKNTTIANLVAKLNFETSLYNSNVKIEYEMKEGDAFSKHSFMYYFHEDVFIILVLF